MPIYFDGIALGASTLSLQANLPALYVAHRIWPAACLLGVMLLLVHTYRYTCLPESRQNIRAVTFGGVLALVPLVSFSLLPDAVLHQPFAPYELTFLFLPLLPAAYSYAILRYRLIALEGSIDRSAAFILVLVLLGAICTILYMALALLLPSSLDSQSAAGLGMMLLCAMLAIPLYQRLQILVDRIFYGSWYDYRTVVEDINRAMNLPLDSLGIAKTLAQRIRDVMQFERVALVIQVCDKYLAVVSTHNSQDPRPFYLRTDGGLGQYLLGLDQPIWSHSAQENLGDAALLQSECELSGCRETLWLPLAAAAGRSEGVLMVGGKRDGEPMNGRDLEILQTAARHISVSLQNARLIAELQQRSFESTQLHREVLRAREEERKRVARELHDEIIQSLVGLNYHLSQTRYRLGEDGTRGLVELQGEVREILSDVRRICVDLRPPALDSLGLVSALRARIRQFETQTALHVALRIVGNQDQDVPEEIAVCVYRVLQEGLFNIQKHSAAQHIGVQVQISSDVFQLVIEDDGSGFVAPAYLGRLIQEGHFGLAGLRERVDAVGGTLTVTSHPGAGTRLEACVPLSTLGNLPDNLTSRGGV